MSVNTMTGVSSRFSDGYGFVPAPHYGFVDGPGVAAVRKYDDLPTRKYGDDEGSKRKLDTLRLPPEAKPLPLPPAPEPIPLGPIASRASGGRLNLAGLLAPVRSIPLLRQALGPSGLVRISGFSAIVAFPIALIENLRDHVRGRTTTTEFMAGTLADTAGYAMAGLGGTMVGGLIGLVVPGVALVAGMAAGALLSTLYDHAIRNEARAALNKTLGGN